MATVIVPEDRVIVATLTRIAWDLFDAAQAGRIHAETEQAWADHNRGREWNRKN